MTVHLLKLSVGSESVDTLMDWVAERTAFNKKRGWGAVHSHLTRMFPRRKADLLNGGSIYWVIKGVVLVRQRILDFKEVTGDDEIRRCSIILDPKLVETEVQPRRAFQGWRYLEPADAPKDMKKGAHRIAPSLQAELAELGLL